MKQRIWRSVAALVMALAVLPSFAAHASIVIHGTRLIYPMDAKDVPVRLEHKGRTPSLVQVWLDDGDKTATPATAKAPFSITPPVFRLEPHKQRVVRVHHTGAEPADEHERMYWLNVLEVPAQTEGSAERNVMRLSFRTRIRVFLRPAGLPFESGAAPAKLQWRLVEADGQRALEVTNPTPYHISLRQAALVHGGQRHEKAASDDVNAGIVMPGGARKRFVLPDLDARPIGPAEVEFTVVNDFGVARSLKAGLAP